MSEVSSACYMFPDSATQCTALVVCLNVSSTLSVVGSVLTLGIIVLFRKYRDFSQRLIANLSVSALLHAISLFVTNMNESATVVCVFQGALLAFAVSASCNWVVVIMLNIYWIVVYKTSLEHKERTILIVCWTLPFVFMGVPFLGDDVYGPAGVWCWMRNKWQWRFGAWYILRILSVIVFIIVTVRLINYIRKLSLSSRNVTDGGAINTARRDINTLRLYPVAYMLLSIFSIVNRIQNAAHGSQSNEEHIFPLILLQTIVGPLFGAVLALVFLFDHRTRKLLRWKEFKKACQNHYRPKDKISEYPTSETNTSSENQNQSE